MTAPWMPPLPEPTAWRVDASFFAHYDSIPFALLPPVGNPKPLFTVAQMRQAQADAARVALEQAAAAMRNELVSATTDQTIRDAARWFATWLEMKANEITP